MARTEINRRIYKTMEDQGKRAADLCRVLGISTGLTTTWKQRGTDPPAKYIAQIAEFLDVSPLWLLTGRDDNSLYKPDELEVIDLYRALTPELKQFIIQSMRASIAASAAASADASEKLA